MKKLVRVKNGMLAGVCGGVADYFGIDPTVVRVIWVIFALCGLIGVIAYIACAIIIPLDDDIIG